MADPTIQQKTCTRCKAVKPAADFYRHPHQKSGLQPHCKVCDNGRRRIRKRTPKGQEQRKRQYEQAKIMRPGKMSPAKTCNHCHTAKPADRFGYRPMQCDGMSSTCMDCSNKERHASLKDYKRKSREADPVLYKLKNNAHYRRSLYGMTPDCYLTILKAQRNACAICGHKPNLAERLLDVDHDHADGKVRGLLCNHCNVAIGRFQDSIDLLRKAIKYLEKHQQLRLVS